MRAIIKAVTLLMISLFLFGAADLPVGSIKPIEGVVFISRQGEEIRAVLGQSVFQQDVIRTEAKSRVGIIFHDDTTLSLGANSTVEVKAYLFEPKNQSFSFVVRMLKGTFVYLSGLMGKLAPDAIRLETPDSSIGVRGTKLLIQVEEQ